jgi:hypothetical protein
LLNTTIASSCHEATLSSSFSIQAVRAKSKVSNKLFSLFSLLRRYQNQIHLGKAKRFAHDVFTNCLSSTICRILAQVDGLAIPLLSKSFLILLSQIFTEILISTSFKTNSLIFTKSHFLKVRGSFDQSLG